MKQEPPTPEPMPSETQAPDFKPPVAILGVPFDGATLAEAITRIEAMVESRQPHHLITANLDFLVQAQTDVELRRILLDAHLVLCDGMPLVWASRLLGNPLPERVAGSDLVPRLLGVAAQKGYRVFFLGGAPDVAASAVARMKARHPALNIVGHYSPPVRPLLEMDHDEITRRIRSARPDLLFASLGCPKAEKWLAMHYRTLGVPVAVGVGATIDFLAGRVKRAPRWMQEAGVEWIFRLLQEPRRLFARYARDLWCFSRKLPAQWLRLQHRRAKSPGPTTDPVVIAEPLWLRLRLQGRLDLEGIQSLGPLWSDMAGRHCLLELDEVKWIDSSGLGCLLGLRRQLLATQHELVLLAPSEPVRRALRWSRLEDAFLVAQDAAEAHGLIETKRHGRSEAVATRWFGPTEPLYWPGEITASNASQYWESAQAQFQVLAGHSRKLVVDLSELRFIDSTGLGILIRAQKEAAQRQVELRFVNAQSNVRNVIRLARLGDVLLEKAA